MKVTLKYGWGKINEVRALSLEGLDRTRLNEIMQKKRLDSANAVMLAEHQAVVNPVAEGQDTIVNAADFMAMLQNHYKHGNKILKKFIWKVNEKVMNKDELDDFLDDDLDPVDGDFLDKQIQEIVNKTGLSNTEKKGSPMKSSGSSEITAPTVKT